MRGSQDLSSGVRDIFYDTHLIVGLLIVQNIQRNICDINNIVVIIITNDKSIIINTTKNSDGLA